MVTRQDIINVLGLSRGRSVFIALRRYNAGHHKMMLVPGGNRHGKCQALRSTIVFNREEVDYALSLMPTSPIYEKALNRLKEDLDTVFNSV